MSQTDHWQRAYSTQAADQLGWYAPHLRTSMAWIAALDLPPDAPILDVGGGASTLVDDLLGAGFEAVSVLDLSERALSTARVRLGDRADSVAWLQGDVTRVALPSRHFVLWHDRATFHFLVEPEHRRSYRDRLRAALRIGGHLIMATFAPEAPPQCSGLPVQRYDVAELACTLGPGFELVHHQTEVHTTPWGLEQMYLYCQFRRVP